MTKLFIPLFYCVIIIYTACSSLTENGIPKSFSCFEGTWQQENTNIFEIWQKQDNILSGQVIKIENADTLLLESLRIFQSKTKIYYEATVPSQNNGQPVQFKLTKQNRSNFHFENPNHDFPKKIVYTFKNKNELTAIISGGEKQKTFIYQKIHTK